MIRIRLLIVLTVLLVLGGSALAGRAQSAGQIAIAAQDGNIYLYDLAADLTVPLTQDAVANRKVYTWPTWSNDGRLAFFGTSTLPGDRYQLGIFLQRALGETERLYTSRNETFTYANWAPADCPAGNCRDLAVLYTTARGSLALRRLRVDGTVSITELSEGGPHYWDWSPDGAAMFWVRYGSELAIFDSTSGAIAETFDDRPGFQRAVDWSPVDDRLLAAIHQPGRGNSLAIFDGAERVVLADHLRGAVSFEWSPDGRRVAFLDEQRAALTVVDARTGAPVAAAPDDVYAFFWAPDSARLAYVTLPTPGQQVLTRQRGGPLLQWVVFEPDSGIISRLASFVPNLEMIYYLRFFDQFARSHRLWSPDSRYLTYAEVLDDGRSVVSLVDTTGTGTPRTLMDGRIGVFSW